MNDVCAVVVTYNRKELLKENIEALLDQTERNLDILIVDNNSTDGTYKYIKEYIKNKKIEYINTHKNIGGAGGFYTGVKECVKRKYKYVWLMDDDTIPSREALNSLMKKKEILRGQFSFIGSVVKFNDEEICKMNIQTVSNTWLEKYEYIKCGLVSIKTCSFVSCFINLDVVKIAGLPIKEFFIYADDVEFTIRLSKVLPGYIDTESIVYHKMKHNVDTNIICVEKERIDRAFYTYRNIFYVAKKEGTKEILMHILRYMYYFFLIIFKAHDNRLKRLKAITLGFVAGIFFNPKIEKIDEQGGKEIK